MDANHVFHLYLKKCQILYNLHIRSENLIEEACDMRISNSMSDCDVVFNGDLKKI